MKTLRVLLRHFDDEIEGVVEYVGDAMTVKTRDPDLSKAYLEMAKQEYEHASKAHTWACKYIDQLCESSDSTLVKEVFEDKKQHMLKELAKAQAYLSIYK